MADVSASGILQPESDWDPFAVCVAMDVGSRVAFPP